MSKSGRELEVKYLILDLPRLKKRLQSLGAKLIRPRVHEHNIRFDAPTAELRRTHRILRLRKDVETTITFKWPARTDEGVSNRRELELYVDDFEAAERLFQALGYQAVMVYEKYRTIYEIGGCVITLDEMPYGDFVEVEAPDAKSIQEISGLIQLDWQRRILDNYVDLFEAISDHLGLTFRDITFDDFEGIKVSPEAVGAHYADVA
jgi:adenylate cyclase class 2